MTAREQDVMDLLGQHLTHAEIAERLFLSVRTVESHAASLRRKLGLADHRSLVRFASEHRRLPAAPTVALTSFIGREGELAEIHTALASHRLVTLVGPGGAGKTRLALAAAERTTLRARVVDLARLTSEALLEDVVADACGAVRSSRRGPFAALVLALGAEPTLLVLDNAEQLANGVAVLIDRLLPCCPQLKVLATSRVRLALPFEQVLPLAGLSLLDARALFTERARAAGMREPLDMKRVDDICTGLGGLALAVELAAARLPALGFEGVEAGLLDQSALLAGGAHLPARHRSMRGTLEWSVSQLEAAARITLRRLTVMASVFDVGAAEAVAGFAPVKPEEIAAALGELVEHSLLVRTTRDGRNAYGMLEPIRQFAREEMTADDEPANIRHLRWCQSTLTPLVDEADPNAGLRDLDDDVRNALNQLAERPSDESSRLGQTYALLLFRSGRLREAQDLFEAAGDLASAAAVAKCRVLGDEALRLELAAAARESGRAGALAFVRAAELATRFAGMFRDEIPSVTAERWLEQARASAPEDDEVVAAIDATRAGMTPGSGLAALQRLSTSGNVLLQSAAMDAACGDLIFAGDLAGARQLAIQRVARLLTRQYDPAGGLELKDALHMGVLCALGAGDLELAMDFARRQGQLGFLREERDLAEDGLLAPAALLHDWETVIPASLRFLADWIDAGRPVAPGRALYPAAVALAHGLRDEPAQRQDWLAVTARIRGVPLAEASMGSGYGELFDALVLLHQGQPALALEVLRHGEALDGFYTALFQQWLAGLRAEAAVLAGVESGEIERARPLVTGNPVASAALARAEAAAVSAGWRRQAARSERRLNSSRDSWR